MVYLFAPTAAGLNLLAGLSAGQKLVISRISFGDGILSVGDDISALTALINPVADGASTPAIVRDNTVSFTVEYRSDMHGGLQEEFWLREFGIFALDENGSEVLLYYANLGDKAQHVSAYTDGMVDIRRFLLSIALSGDLDVIIQMENLTVLTSADLNAHNLDPTAHPDIRALLNQFRLEVNELANRVQLIEDSTIIGGIAFAADLVDLANVTIANGVWNPASGSISANG